MRLRTSPHLRASWQAWRSSSPSCGNLCAMPPWMAAALCATSCSPTFPCLACCGHRRRAAEALNATQALATATTVTSSGSDGSPEESPVPAPEAHHANVAISTSQTVGAEAADLQRRASILQTHNSCCLQRVQKPKTCCDDAAHATSRFTHLGGVEHAACYSLRQAARKNISLCRNM